MGAAELKARLEQYVREREADLLKLEDRYLDEKVRMVNQITAAKLAVTKWDGKADVLIATLEAAGIQIKP